MRGPSPLVAVIVVGSAGSGKSTIARSLARELHAAYVDKDSICGPLVGVALDAVGADPNERESSEFYRERVMPSEYLCVFQAARDNLRNDLSVIIDAPFAAYLDDSDFLERSMAQAEWPEVRTVVLRVSASEDVTRARLVARGLERDFVKLDDWATFWKRWGSVPIRWSSAQVVDVTNDVPVDGRQLVSAVLEESI